MDVGVAAIGYGDGYPRAAPAGTPVLVNGVRVPVIHFHDEVEGLIVMEDAGDLDLWSFRHASWIERRA